MTEHSLIAPHVVEYDYTRSLGPVLSRFVTGLRDGVVKGTRTKSGRVVVPPVEFDPETCDDLGADALVDVGDSGVVTAWAWVHEPLRSHPFDHPFAWVLVKLDGADTPLLHALDVPGEENVSSGMRVRIRWAEDRTGGIRDIACFEPEGAA